MTLAKGQKQTSGRAKLLDAWTPPNGAGAAVGCLATSFTFSPVFFEEECLGRFLQMQSDAVEDGPIYVIEREEKLAEVQCVSALVDAHHCRGQRSLRWDLLVARVPGAILHAKVSVLWWQHCVRLIIASANLTEDGYRRNREIFAEVDYTDGGGAPLTILDSVLDFLQEAGTYAESYDMNPSPAISRWNGFLASVRATTRDWGSNAEQTGRKTSRAYAVLTGPGRESALDQLRALWPEGVPSDAIITSPFFDPPEIPNRPASMLWRILRQRGEATVTYFLIPEKISGTGSFFVHAPETLLHAQPLRPSCRTYVGTIEEQDEEGVGAFRQLHMKSIWLAGGDWHGHLIGSGNFTSAGLGLGKRPNLEAGIFYIVSKSGNPAAAKLLLDGSPDGEVLDPDTEIQWLPKSIEGEDEPDESVLTLPSAFSQAIYSRKNGSTTVTLLFKGKPPGGWIVYKTPDSDDVLIGEEKWKTAGEADQVELLWEMDMAPSGIEVAWRGANGRAWWPVNVDRAASLPPPAELKDLPLDLLIGILTSARPLYQVMKEWEKKRAGKSSRIPINEIYDPHKHVDTSGFLLQKTYRVSAALMGLRQRLERPAVSTESLAWRLRGPVGVFAVAKAIEKEARSDDECAFLLAELALEVLRAEPMASAGYLPVSDVVAELKIVAGELKGMACERLSTATGTMKRYIQGALEEEHR